MYKEHPTFDQPSEDTILWRYMDFAEFVSLLERKALFFARGDLLDDPFEGTFPKGNAAVRPHIIGENIPEEVFEEAKQARSRVFSQSRPAVLVNCWHENNYESAAMWEKYAKFNAGIAIRTTFIDFTSSLIDDQDIHIGRVKYIDYETGAIPDRSVVDPFLYKRPFFSHEREVRALTFSTIHLLLGDDLSLRIVDSEGISFEAKGTYSKVDLGQLVHEVVVSPNAEDWFYDLVQSISQRYGLKATIRRSSLSDRPTSESTP